MNSVIIFSDYNDTSTHEVSDWLDFYNADYNIYEFNDLINLSLSSIHYNENDKQKIRGYSFWMRKHSKLNEELVSHIEIDLLINEIRNEKCFWLNKYNDLYVNKSLQLKTAKCLGLRIPDTLFSGNKDDIDKFIENRKCIIKRIDLLYKDSNYVWYTQEIKNTDSLPDGYFIIQEYIDKEIEIRTFYLDGTFYSMAIFSQLDDQTKVDFRKYNYKKPNRTVPIKLPKGIESKLDQLFRKLNLNSGSVDLIKNNKNQYFFLEINPYGQFNMVSKPCNYNIEEQICIKLLRQDEK